MKKKLNWLKNIVICFGALALCGCSALQYSGEDFNKENQFNVTTNESFYFKAYKKQLNSDVAVKVGITTTSIPDIFVVYLCIQNNGEYPYNVDIRDISIKTGDRLARYVKTSEYISSYQDKENALLAASQGLAPTLNSVANIANHYQNDNYQLAMAENNEAEITLKQIASVVSGIESHTLRNISQVQAHAKEYYYLFVEDMELYPIVVSYSGLKYTFNKK